MKKVLLCTIMILLYVCFSTAYSAEPTPSQNSLPLLFVKNAASPQTNQVNTTMTNSNSTLIKKINVNQDYEVGPITLTIKTINYFHTIPSDEQKPLYNMISVDWEICNSAEEDFIFTPIALIEMSSGQKIAITRLPFPNDIMGWESKSGTFQFPIASQQSLNAELTTLYTGDIMNVNNRKLVNGIKISLKKK